MLIVINEDNNLVLGDLLDAVETDEGRFIVYGDKMDKSIHFARFDDMVHVFEIPYEEYIDIFDSIYDWRNDRDLADKRSLLIFVGLTNLMNGTEAGEMSDIDISDDDIFFGDDDIGQAV